MKFLSALLVAVGLALPLPASAATYEDQSVATALAVIDQAPQGPATLVSHPMPAAAVRPDAGPNTPFFANFIATAPYTAGAPCFNCGTGNDDLLGMGVPYNYVYSGYPQSVVVSWTSLNYSGGCNIAIVISSGTHVIQKVAHYFTGIGDGAYDAFYYLPKMGWNGGAVMVGKVECGGRVSVTKAPIVFQ